MVIQRSRPPKPSVAQTTRLTAAICCSGALIGSAFGVAGARDRASRETVLLSLPQGSATFGTPFVAGDGVVYGASSAGGIGYGVAFALLPPRGRQTTWSEAILDDFSRADGATPLAGLTPGPDGTLYGTTSAGGISGYGTVFRLLPPPKGQYYWTERVLHDFTGVDGDGIEPYGGSLVVGPDGSAYGTTITSYTGFCGMAFRLTPPPHRSTKPWRETILHDFAGAADGCQPFAGLLPDGSGGFFGAAVDGGAGCECGTIYQLSPPQPGSSSWTETTIYSFMGQAMSDGSGPYGTLVRGRHGELYGTTEAGGTANLGTVFALVPPSGSSTQWTETVLHSFTGSPDGQNPFSPVTLGSGGRVFGTAASGGTTTYGIAFVLTPPRHRGTTWHEAILHVFTGYPDGQRPDGGLAFGPDGALYGVTYGGGASGGGALVRIVP